MVVGMNVSREVLANNAIHLKMVVLSLGCTLILPWEFIKDKTKQTDAYV